MNTLKTIIWVALSVFVAVVLNLAFMPAQACEGDNGRFWIGMQVHDQNHDVTMESLLGEIGYEHYLMRSKGATLGLTIEHKSGAYGDEVDDGFNAIGFRFGLEY